MEFIRWYSWPVLAGFLLSLFFNPLIAGLGFLVWLMVIGYVLRRAL